MTTLTNPIPGILRQVLNMLSHAWQQKVDAREVPQTARELHAMADRYQAGQPGFAADLRAAADRQT